MKYFNHFSMAAVALMAMLLAPACTHDHVEAPVALPRIQLTNSATFGNRLTDSVGYSLYYFSNDFDGKSNCTGGCLDVWPVYYAGDNLSAANLAPGLNIADFGTITNSTGAKQTTYKSWPLYYYSVLTNGAYVRENPGEIKGEAVGNVWFVAKPDYSITQVNTQLIGNNGKSYKSDYTEGTGKTLYFADPRGVTLYAFSPDSFNVNRYTKPDFSNNNTWPIYETDKVVVPSTLDATLFASANVYGKKQLTYKGWPLYYFGPDSSIRGRNKGVSVSAPGVWPVVVKAAPTAPK